MWFPSLQATPCKRSHASRTSPSLTTLCALTLTHSPYRMIPPCDHAASSNHASCTRAADDAPLATALAAMPHLTKLRIGYPTCMPYVIDRPSARRR